MIKILVALEFSVLHFLLVILIYTCVLGILIKGIDIFELFILVKQLLLILIKAPIYILLPYQTLLLTLNITILQLHLLQMSSLLKTILLNIEVTDILIWVIVIGY